MEIEEFTQKINVIKNLGFVPNKRFGNTGIGYTLETLLGIKENNIRLPDLGKIELKSKRKNVATFVTMFTFNSGVWKIKQADVVNKYGYTDKKGRQALKCFVRVEPNAQGLFLKVTKKSLRLFHVDNTLIAEWDSKILLDCFSSKLTSTILVLAETKLDEGKEMFHYQDAYLLENPSEIGILKLIAKDYVVVDLRMHLNPSGSVRNRGTAFRIDERNLDQCFSTRIKIL